MASAIDVLRHDQRTQEEVIAAVSTLSVDDLILDPARYREVRSDHRSRAIEARRERRIKLGDIVGLEFENADTLRYQAQEMLYVEGVTDPMAAAAEIAVYERMLPSARALKATLLIEITDAGQVRSELARLDGLHDCVRLEVADQISAGRDIPPPDEGPASHTVAVHFLAFDLAPAMLQSLTSGAAGQVVIDHPEYQATAALSPALLATLASDIAEAG